MLPLGLLELDTNGTVLYFKPDRESNSSCSAADVVGRNLFTDIAPIAGDGRFQERIKTFRRNHAPVDNFHYTFDCNHDYISVRVLLARIHEQSVLGSSESVLIHIRQQADSIAA